MDPVAEFSGTSFHACIRLLKQTELEPLVFEFFECSVSAKFADLADQGSSVAYPPPSFPHFLLEASPPLSIRPLSDPLALILAPLPAKGGQRARRGGGSKVGESIDQQIGHERIALRKKGPIKALAKRERYIQILYQYYLYSAGKSSEFPAPLRTRSVDGGEPVLANHHLSQPLRNAVGVLDLLVQVMEVNGTVRCLTADATDSKRERQSQSSTNNNRISTKHCLLKLPLAPLRSILADLERGVGPGS
ncbi:hypothetical protein EDC04DRAFT_2896969 [Pisolithus marmoratus]|nr:hypothetical protein EDC04DRAFT_2896969 [Pisolithus marmoratus]